MSKETGVSLTEGNIFKQLLKFVWPILLANVFEQIYNLTNAMIVGNYVSKEALSAVSASSTIANVYNYLFYGLGLGSGIVIATYYGAKRKDKIKESIETSLIIAVIGGILLTIISQLLIPFLMDVSNIKPELYNLTYDYLSVYVLGTAAVLTYKMCFFILRSIGDSKTPLKYLVLSCLINLVLGVIFVRFLNLSVIGTALATIISQFIADILCLRKLLSLKEVQFDIKNISFSWRIFWKICGLGIPAGIQNMLIAVSTMMVQSYVNLLPNEYIAGIGVSDRVSVFAHIPMGAISTVTVNMVSQNMGAKLYERAQQVIKNSIKICNIITLITSTTLFITAPFWVSLFNKDPLIISTGATAIRITVYSYIPLGWSHVYHGAIRGAGNVREPMMIAIFAQCICRYLFVYFGLKLLPGNIYVIYMSSAFGFTLAGIIASLYFHNSSWTKEKRLRV